MVIGMLLETEYPKDIRVRKEAESLVAGGIKVVVIVPWREGESREETVNGVNVRRIGSNYTHKRRGITDVITALFFVNWMFYRRMGKIIQEYGITHLHAHDLPMAKTAYLLKKKVPGKVILDSHENYPELLEGWFMTKKSFFIRMKNNMLFKPSRWRRYERRIMPKMDRLIVVIDEMKNKFIDWYGLKESEVLVVANYEKKGFAKEAEKLASDGEFVFDPETFYLVYVGGIGPMRGLDTVIDSVTLLKEDGRKVQFIVLGSGNPTYIQGLHDQIAENKLNDEVHFLGYKPFEKINYYMKKAGLNVIPHVKNGHTDYTIPHKLFQIFLSKRPVLVSSCKPLKRMVDTCDGGWVFEASNAEDFANKVVEVMESSNAEIVKKTENSFNKAMEDWNWENEGDKLISFYEEL